MDYLFDSLLDGRPPVFDTPQEFLMAAVRYFRWIENHPLQEEKIFQYQGEIIRDEQSKMRPYTKQGLASFLRIPVSRLDSYKGRQDPEWAEAVEMVEQIMYEQKFSGAAAGLLNSQIISRDLGLAEKSELSGPGGGPIKTEEVSARDVLANRIARVASAAGNAGDSGGADGDAG